VGTDHALLDRLHVEVLPGNVFRPSRRIRRRELVRDVAHDQVKGFGLKAPFMSVVKRNQQRVRSNVLVQRAGRDQAGSRVDGQPSGNCASIVGDQLIGRNRRRQSFIIGLHVKRLGSAVLGHLESGFNIEKRRGLIRNRKAERLILVSLGTLRMDSKVIYSHKSVVRITHDDPSSRVNAHPGG